MSNFIVINLFADGLAPLGVKASVGTLMIKFVSHILKVQAFENFLYQWPLMIINVQSMAYAWFSSHYLNQCCLLVNQVPWNKLLKGKTVSYKDHFHNNFKMASVIKSQSCSGLCINTLWPSNTIYQKKSVPIFAQVMACLLQLPREQWFDKQNPGYNPTGWHLCYQPTRTKFWKFL